MIKIGVLDSGNYLHLWYGNFDNNHAIIKFVADKKEEIKQRAINRMKIAGNTSKTTEKEFEEWYRIKSQKDLDNQISISPVFNSLLGELDDVARDFKAALKMASTLTTKRSVVNYAITLIDNILAQGANTGFTTQAALEQIKTVKTQMEEALQYFSKWADYNSKGKNAIEEAISTMESGTVGYAFELADKLGFLTANQKGLNDVHDLYINIGGNSSFIKTQEDPEFSKDLKILADALSSNNGQLAKGDQILFYHTGDGQGRLSVETKYAVFQDKNYTNISRVTIAEKTFGQLGIEREFGTNNLVNLAAGLGSGATGFARQLFSKQGIKQTGMGFKNTAPKNNTISQGELDNAWQTVRESMRLLAISDAIAGEIGANLTMRPNYYVIRSRISGEVHVVGVSTILDKIRTALQNNANQAMGIRWNFSNEGWKSHTREKFWIYNIGNFNTGKNPEAALTRSALAYPLVINAIISQKTRISLNFSEFFTNY